MPGKRVTIVRTVPVVERGLTAELSDHDFETVSVSESNLRQWATDGGMVVVGVHDESDIDLVIDLRDGAPDAVVVALVDTEDDSLATQALRAGASSSVPADADTPAVVWALQAAEGNLSIVPASIAESLGAFLKVESVPLSDAELGWLRGLAAGSTVAELAQGSGYSQREMFRLLGSCYRKLGAESRISALLTAAKLGLV